MGFDFFGMDNFSENMNCVNSIYSVQIQNSIVDQISVRANTTGITYFSTKEVWNYDEILLADFINNLEAGNINNAGVPIVSLLFMKKKTTDLTWNTVATIPFLINQSKYQFNDYYVASNVSYDYAMIPVGVSGVQGQWIIETIIPSWDGTFLIDNTNNFKFYYNLKWDAIPTNNSMGKYEAIGSQFPIIVFGSLNYRSGKITNTYISDDSINRTGTAPNGINLLAERTGMDALLTFITNKKPKILKDGQGRYLLIVTNQPIEMPNNNVAGAIADVSFDFVEVGIPNNGTLTTMNLGNVITN